MEVLENIKDIQAVRYCYSNVLQENKDLLTIHCVLYNIIPC